MTRALVLSGGGPVGIAWQIGLTTGLAARGVDVSTADLFIGTSAGSVVGAELARGGDLQDEIDWYRDAPDGVTVRDASPSVQQAPTPQRLQGLVAALEIAYSLEASAEEQLTSIGAYALGADTPGEDDFVSSFRRLDGIDWPERFRCTAVDAVSGESVVWDATDGVPLPRAVAASCAVPGVFPPITVGESRYMDGGMRSLTNADHAHGAERVLVVSIIGALRIEGDSGLLRYIRRTGTEIDELAERGANVTLLSPDPEAASILGVNFMDFGHVGPGLEAGLGQAERCAADVRAFWDA